MGKKAPHVFPVKLELTVQHLGAHMEGTFIRYQVGGRRVVGMSKLTANECVAHCMGEGYACSSGLYVTKMFIPT